MAEKYPSPDLAIGPAKDKGPERRSGNPVKTTLRKCYAYLRENLSVNNEMSAKLFGWDPKLLDEPTLHKIRALNEHGNPYEAFEIWYQYAGSGYTEERLRVFCECLEEVGKDAKPKLIEVAKEIRESSSTHDIPGPVDRPQGSTQKDSPPVQGRASMQRSQPSSVQSSVSEQDVTEEDIRSGSVGLQSLDSIDPKKPRTPVQSDPRDRNLKNHLSRSESCDIPASDKSGSDTREQSNEVKFHTDLTESKGKEILPMCREREEDVTLPCHPNLGKKNDEPSFNQLQNSELAVRPSTSLSKECTDNNGTWDSSSEMVPCAKGMKHFYHILKLTSCSPQRFSEEYRGIRKEGMTNVQLSRDSWEHFRVNPQADPLLKCVYFCLGITSAPDNLDYILETWKDLSQQLTRGESFEIGSLFGLYLLAWTIYNCAEYGSLPNHSENILLLGQLTITLSKNGAMKLIDYCIKQTEFMSGFPLKPFFHITQLRWEFEYKHFMGYLNKSVAEALLKGINKVFQLCDSFDQEWMKTDSFGAMGSAINLKIVIAIWFKERKRDDYMFRRLKGEAEDNLQMLTEYFERNRSDIPIYDEAWLCSVRSKFYRMIGEEPQAHRYAEDAANLYLECGRDWRALEEAKHTGDPTLIQYYQSACSDKLKTGTQYDLCCVN